MLEKLIEEQQRVSDRPIRSAINSTAEAVTYGAKMVGEVTKLGYYTIATETNNAKIEYFKGVIQSQSELDKLIASLKTKEEA